MAVLCTHTHTNTHTHTHSDMASHLLDSTGDILEMRMDECCRILHGSGEGAEMKRSEVMQQVNLCMYMYIDVRVFVSTALNWLIIHSTPIL